MNALIISLFKIIYYPFDKKFKNALANCEKSQQNALKRILKNSNMSLAEFEGLPYRNYEEFNGKFHSSHKVLFYETTSGSSGVKKEIPYTKMLISDFTHMFLLWAFDLVVRSKLKCRGKIFFSISPQFIDDSKRDDSSYLAGFTGFVFNLFSAVPQKIKKIKDPDQFFFVLSLYLLSAKRLSVISIWSPSYLISILKIIDLENERIIKALERGQYEVDHLTFKFRKVDHTKMKSIKEKETSKYFTGLELISCWGANASKIEFNHFKTLFSGVHIQEKGLLATEAPMSFPYLNSFSPLVDRVYYEFRDELGTIYKLSELKAEVIYELMFSQVAGLIKYRIGDKIKVTGFIGDTPHFKFIERVNSTSDLVGEKLSESYLINKLSELNMSSEIILIASQEKMRYFIFSNVDVEKVINDILYMNPHYKNAILNKQLNHAIYEEIFDLHLKMKQFYIDKKNMNFGDIKDQILIYKDGDEIIKYLLAK